ncbi:MAG: thioesterase family protein [Desulfobacteraceae bacterium]|nr:thioesterase family protein [Desulfobacteraceae bacterium]
MVENDRHILDKDIELKKIESKIFSVIISDNWSIHGTPNGGYLMSVIAKAMEYCSDKKETPIITVNYISKCLTGEAVIYVEVISESSNFTRLMVRLLQQGKEKIRAFGTFSSDLNGSSVQRYETGPPILSEYEESIRVPVMENNALFDHIDLRLDPSCAGWISGNLSKQAEFKGWIGFKDNRPIDIPAILLFADIYPPPVYARFGVSAWIPTIELSVNVRKIPDTQVLKGVFRSHFISGGLVEEDGELWDENNELVAISRQISKYRHKNSSI